MSRYPRTPERQARVDRILKDEVYCLQNEVVELVLKTEENYDDIHNFYIENEDTDEQEPVEVYQWFAVSGWLAQMLKEIGYPVLVCDYGNWMGRVSYGQALEMDSVWDDVLNLLDKFRSEAANV